MVKDDAVVVVVEKCETELAAVTAAGMEAVGSSTSQWETSMTITPSTSRVR